MAVGGDWSWGLRGGEGVGGRSFVNACGWWRRGEEGRTRKKKEIQSSKTNTERKEGRFFAIGMMEIWTDSL